MVHIEAQERVFVLPAARPRVIGPGRREQGYREQILRLEAERQRAELERGRLAQELEWSARVERGSVRRSERLEGELRASEEAQKRLLLALGAVQRENELLRQKVAALGAGATPQLESRAGARAAAAPSSKPFWRRWFAP